MLELKKVTKIYETDNFKQKALDDVSISFRDCEFVSILGPSGSGKTTLLNIIGGLDKYTSGDLIINGVSTKKYNDRDWDTYRNHKIGFVFQSYNLIPHQSVLANVELALTLSGVSRNERRQRAIDALKKVGLEKHIYKRPNQLSGGQMQRVAIARALINNPDIVLADEPTGALDSKTSTQIMDLLAEVAKDRLVIMVTHNAELANTYSTRIIELRDGVIKGDTNLYKDKDKDIVEEKNKKTNMSFKTALSLSLNNLLTKKGRTILTAFAGSIGIIGIALILSLSHGVQSYIDQVQKETLTSYPLTIESATIDIADLMTTQMKEPSTEARDKGIIVSNNTVTDTLSLMSSKVQSNNLTLFKKYLESEHKLDDYTTAISYVYNLDLQLYKSDTTDGIVQVNPNTVMASLGFDQNSSMGSNFVMGNVWSELFANDELNNKMYEVVSGRMPESYNEVVILVDKNNRITDFVLYALGIKDQKELEEMYKKLLNGEEVKSETTEYQYEDFIGLSYKILLNTDYYQKKKGMWINSRDDEKYMKQKIAEAEEIKVVGIIRPSDESTVTMNALGGILYTSELEDYVIDKINESAIVKEQKENPEKNILTGLKFSDSEFDMSKLSNEQKKYLATLSPEQLADVIARYREQAGATYDSVMHELGSIDYDNPEAIYIYAKDFESKDEIKNLIADYNDDMRAQDREADVINYSDLVGMLMSSVTSIVDMISYVLIGFVSISLIVSSIMIGIITYISVLERTKEIGILRAIGASKKDISRVFNAETLIVGLIAGVIGILVTIILNIPINLVIASLANVKNLSKLPIVGGLTLIIISVILTMIAGLIPARMASKKDPVESLRTE